MDLLRKYRRDLHRIPEDGFQEFKTKAYILNVLKDLDCEITEVAKTGVCAFFKGPEGNGSVAFRCDMDALPVTERTGAEYASTHEGFMHACGHDGNMTMALGLAQELEKRKGTLPCGVLLIFQPAEENIGGAKHICETNILEKYNVKRIFGWHLGPFEKPGVILGRPGDMMARVCHMDVIVHGKSAHCASHHKAIDAMEAACEFLCRCYKMERTEIPEGEFRLLKFGRMESGNVRNVISDCSRLQGSFRSYDDAIFEKMRSRMFAIAKELEAEFGCTIEFEMDEGYPAVRNDEELYEKAMEALQDFEVVTLRKPNMTAEDFSFYQQRVPGIFLFIGTGRKEPLHDSCFDFDESILEVGVKAWLKLLEMPL
ncbi:MAG: amidohydrolase [Firmicutes bacterium]|nr:amidohydrolase [Bacillota bacterium]